MCTCNQLSKRSQMQSLLEKPTSIRSAYFYHTHMHVALCMHRCSFMPNFVPLSRPLPSLPLAHSNRMSQRMYAGVPRCMPIGRLGLIHHTMPSHIRTPFSTSLVNVWVRGMACVCMCVSQRAELKACVCLLGVNARIFNNGGLKVG